MTSVRIEVTTVDLLRAFADVKTFAATDGTLPMLCAVQLEFGGTDLHMIATDRYTLGVTRLPVGQEIVQPPRVVRTDEIERIEKAFRPPRGLNPSLAVEFGDEGLSVETTATLDGEPTHRLAVPWFNGKVPGWREILAGVDREGDVVGAAHFTPQYLAKFSKLQREDEPVRIHPGSPTKPWRVTVGDHFVGLIMPCRYQGSAWTPSAVNVAPEPKKRAARTKKAA